MTFSNLLHKILANFYFNPKCRKVEQALKFLDSLKSNPEGTYAFKFLSHKVAQVKSLQNQIVDICETMVETMTDHSLNIKNILEHKSLSDSDSIHNDNVKKLIDYGITQMQKSKDPFHDFSHIYRCLKLAKIYFVTYKKKYNLDWGTVVTAIVFHDISRTNHLSFLYSNKFLKPFEYIPFMLDFSLVSNVYTDAERSADMFIQESKHLDLPTNFVSNVIYGILGTSPSASDLKLDSIFFKLVCDVDKLDMFSIGRFESGLRNVLIHKMGNMRYFNRSNLLASLMIKKSRQNLHLNISIPIFDSFVESLKQHGKMFYPLDAKILS